MNIQIIKNYWDMEIIGSRRKKIISFVFWFKREEKEFASEIY
jgi:hypothetical protein